MTDTLRIAVVGAANIARRYHLPSLARLSKKGKVELVALCDIDEHRAQAMGVQPPSSLRAKGQIDPLT